MHCNVRSICVSRDAKDTSNSNWRASEGTQAVVPEDCRRRESDKRSFSLNDIRNSQEIVENDGFVTFVCLCETMEKSRSASVGFATSVTQSDCL